MTLDDAIAKLDAEFGARDTEEKANEIIDVASGGVRTDPESPPGLYVSRDAAILSWFRAVADVLREKDPARWHIVGDVNVDTWNITIADEKNSHRIAAQRYSVCAAIGINGAES